MSTVLQELFDAVGTLGMRMMHAMQAHSVGHLTYYDFVGGPEKCTIVGSGDSRYSLPAAGL